MQEENQPGDVSFDPDEESLLASLGVKSVTVTKKKRAETPSPPKIFAEKRPFSGSQHFDENEQYANAVARKFAHFCIVMAKKGVFSLIYERNDKKNTQKDLNLTRFTSVVFKNVSENLSRQPNELWERSVTEWFKKRYGNPNTQQQFKLEDLGFAPDGLANAKIATGFGQPAERINTLLRELVSRHQKNDRIGIQNVFNELWKFLSNGIVFGPYFSMETSMIGAIDPHCQTLDENMVPGGETNLDHEVENERQYSRIVFKCYVNELCNEEEVEFPVTASDQYFSLYLNAMIYNFLVAYNVIEIAFP